MYKASGWQQHKQNRPSLSLSLTHANIYTIFLCTSNIIIVVYVAGQDFSIFAKLTWGKSMYRIKWILERFRTSFLLHLYLFERCIWCEEHKLKVIICKHLSDGSSSSSSSWPLSISLVQMLFSQFFILSLLCKYKMNASTFVDSLTNWLQ